MRYAPSKLLPVRQRNKQEEGGGGGRGEEGGVGGVCLLSLIQ